MKILVVGSGGREHALAWKLAASPQVETVWVAPGNGGTAMEPKCRNLELRSGDPAASDAQTELVAFARVEGIDLALIGPEAPLASGIVDRFRAAGIAVVGPDQRAAKLEASKAFSKGFMLKHGVRAAGSRTLTDYPAARDYAREHFSARSGAVAPLVIKADGLAAGKGVVVAEDFGAADAALRAFMVEGRLGAAGRTVVLEDYLRGVEVSVLAAVSVRPGRTNAAIVPFVAARDHKRRFDGARGPNTGGMGAIAPVPDFTAVAQSDFRASILEPTLRGLQADAFDYRGFIFFGLMVDGDRCSLLEYNVRLGDPETQAVLPLLESDLTEVCIAILDGSLSAETLRWRPGAACAPVAVADGYPGTYRKGDAVVLDKAALAAAGAKVFVAGAALGSAGRLITTGGRVLAVSAVADEAAAARDRAYAGLAAVNLTGMGWRTDIGNEIVG